MSTDIYGFNWDPLSLGTFVIIIDVDHYNNIPETDETNNAVSVTVEVLEPPETAITFGEPKYILPPPILGTYVTSSTVFTITATDHSGEGIAHVYYRIGSSAWLDYLVTGDFTLDDEGSTTIEVYGVDAIGGEGQVQGLWVFVDNSAPTTTLTYPGTQVRPSTDLSLEATDDGCGVSSTLYRIDGGPWIQYSIPFALEEGQYTIEYRSIDNLDHEEDIKSIELTVGEQGVAEEVNYKPILSVVLAVVLLIFGLLFWHKRDPDEESEQKGFLDTFDKRSFLLYTVPFALVEFVVGAISGITGSLRVPSASPEGLVVDSLIFIFGIVLAILLKRLKA
jgi:hypothetical protein